MSNTEGHN